MGIADQVSSQRQNLIRENTFGGDDFMRNLFIVSALLLLTACAQTSDLNQEALSQGDITDFSRTESEIGEVFVDKDSGIRPELSNKDFGTIRRWERDVDYDSDLARADDLSSIAIAKNALSQRYPRASFKFLNLRRSKAFDYISFQQFYNGMRIVNSKAIVRLAPGGEWRSISATSIHPDILSELKEQNEEIDLSRLDFIPQNYGISNVESVLYPRVVDEELEIHLSWEIQIVDPKQQEAYLAWIAKDDYELVGFLNPRIRFGVSEEEQEIRISGSILPNSPIDQPIDIAFPFVWLRNLDHSFHSDQDGKIHLPSDVSFPLNISLENDVVKVLNNGGENNGGIVEEDVFDTGEVRLDELSILDERNIYYWVNVADQFVREDLEFEEMNYQLTAFARDGMNMDNAYFNPLLKTLAFGTGDVFFRNTGHQRDVILHEYGHALTHKIYGLKNNFEFNAMNEAFSDYFAAIVTEDPDIGEEGLIDEKREYLRTVDSEMVYPKDYSGVKFHEDGQIFSAALWSLRDRLGPELADWMIHEARLAQAGTIREFLKELLVIDKALADEDDPLSDSPSPHSLDIMLAFLNRGLHSEVKFKPKGIFDFTLPWADGGPAPLDY